MELPASTDWQVSMPHSLSDRLPNDVVLDILVRLPVKSVVRFKCVSKPWCSLLSHPEFVLLHLEKATQGNKSLLFRDIIFEDKEVTIKCTYPEIGNVEVYLVNEAEDDFETDPNTFIYQGCLSCFEREVFSLRSKETIEELGTIQVPAVLSPTSSHFLVGCLNGLICVAEAEYREKYHPTKIFFWNPATKEIRLLPRDSTRRISGLDQVIALGFGYEPATDDYKVIRIRFSGFKNVPEAETYSLRNNRWTETNADMISNCNFPEQVPQANVDGALHWMVHQGKITDYVEDHILAFDIGKEELYRIPLPSFSSEYNPGYFCRNISVYQEHLALFSYLPFAEVKPLDIWVMKEYGKSWTKVKRIRQLDLLLPMHFIDENRAIMMSLKDWQLVLTDADFGRIRNLGLFNFHPIFEYVESLVSP